MQERRSWRELLGKILSEPQEKQRVADELGVRPITLIRWINNQSDPRANNLRRLLNALPEHRDALLALIEEDIEDFSTVAVEDKTEEIPSTFYARVLSAHSATPKTLRAWSIFNLIIQQALKQIDPDRLGLAVLVVRCIPPVNGKKIRSLRESVGYGTTPWRGELEAQALFLGAESLAGYAVTSCRQAVIQNTTEYNSLFPVRRAEYEKSAVAHPIMRAGQIAGCLLVSSTQPDFFLFESRLTLIQEYADLIVLAFEPEEFYEPEDIELRVMPSQRIQAKYFASFRQRIAEVMRQAAIQKQPINTIRAEQLVWSQLEEELLQLPLSLEDEG